jgi:hypothetical protein
LRFASPILQILCPEDKRLFRFFRFIEVLPGHFALQVGLFGIAAVAPECIQGHEAGRAEGVVIGALDGAEGGGFIVAEAARMGLAGFEKFYA